MGKEEYHGIWVIAEKQNDRIQNVTFELLSRARELKKDGNIKEPVTAVLLGENLKNDVAPLVDAGAEKIIIIDDPRLKFFQNETYAVVLKNIIEERKPSIVFIGATAIGSDLAPTLGAKLWTGVAAHCVDLRLNDDQNLVAVVPAFGGKVLGDILCPEFRPQMATVRGGILPKATCYLKGEFLVESYNPEVALKQDKGWVRAVSVTEEEQKEISLEDAKVVVAGGYGLANHDSWKMIEDLAEVTGGAVGCTRPPLDEGFADENQMIGTSGKSVRPDIYIGVGISGATHHLCGMKDAGLIVAINKDEKAPIFEIADLGVVAPAEVILPKLVERLKDDTPISVCGPQNS